jgi:hypothetical protein
MSVTPQEVRSGGEAKSYFTGEDKIIIANQRSGPAGTYKGAVRRAERQVWGEGELSTVVHPTYVLFHESRLWTRMMAIIRISKRLETTLAHCADKWKMFDTAGITTIKFPLHLKTAV